MTTELFVTLVFVGLGLLVARLGAMMRASPTTPALSVRNRYTEADERVWADASRYLGAQLIRLGLGAALLAIVLGGMPLPEGARPPETLVLAINGVAVLSGLCVLFVLHWLYSRERWEAYHLDDID